MDSSVSRSDNAAHLNTAGNMTPFLQFPYGLYSPQQPQQQAPNNLQLATTSAPSQLRPTSNRPSHKMPRSRQRMETLLALPVRQRANTLSSPASSQPTTSSTSASIRTAPAISPLPTTAPAPIPTLPAILYCPLWHHGRGDAVRRYMDSPTTTKGRKTQLHYRPDIQHPTIVLIQS